MDKFARNNYGATLSLSSALMHVSVEGFFYWNRQTNKENKQTNNNNKADPVSNS